MNKKLFSLTLLVIALGGATLWVKWKQDNPTPTSQDLALRQRLLQTKLASIEREFRYYYIVSEQDVKEIANHLLLDGDSKKNVLLSPNHYFIHFHSPGLFYDTIILDEGYKQYFYIANRGRANAGNPKQLHPATVRCLRRWLSQPRIQNYLVRN